MKALLALLIIFSAHAGPSATDCDYYLEAEKEHKCGPRGYLVSFGHRLCEKYLKQEPMARPAVKKWFPKVRLCLQEFIEKNHGAFRDCDDLRKRALESHVGCYKETGFCTLGLQDEAQILRMTSQDLFRPSVISLSLRIKKECQ